MEKAQSSESKRNHNKAESCKNNAHAKAVSEFQNNTYRYSRNEELATIGIGSSVGHG